MKEAMTTISAPRIASFENSPKRSWRLLSNTMNKISKIVIAIARN
jgi:hypothetical protein